MKQAFKELSPFQVNPDKVWADYNLTDMDFSPATGEEKENMVEVRKSVSYWRDAARRFKKNTVSMVALVVFLIMLLFAFLGPKLIPYDYHNQYRSAQKLGPFEYSKEQELVKSVQGQTDCFYATSLRPGTKTSLDAGDYYFEYKGTTYSFTLDKTLGDAIRFCRCG